MKRVTLLKSAAMALRKRRNMAARLRGKIVAYAADPTLKTLEVVRA